MINLNAETKIYGIIGYPVRHSLSPLFQNKAFEELDINAVYLPFEVHPDSLKSAIEGIRALNISGVNVTLPHKEKALDFVDELSEEVIKIGSLNTIKNDRNKLIGFNTDYIGFLESIKELTTLKNKKALVLGAGGTSKAIIYALLKEKANVFLWNRTKEKALSIRESFKNIEIMDSIESSIKEMDIIINTTSVGLKDDDKPIFNYDTIRENQVVFDVIYKETALIKKAKEKGAKTLNGLYMLLYQGAKSFEIWTGVKAPLEAMKKALNLL